VTEISQRKAREYRYALAALRTAVRNEKRTQPFSLNVREALERADRLLPIVASKRESAQ